MIEIGGLNDLRHLSNNRLIRQKVIPFRGHALILGKSAQCNDRGAKIPFANLVTLFTHYLRLPRDIFISRSLLLATSCLSNILFNPSAKHHLNWLRVVQTPCTTIKDSTPTLELNYAYPSAKTILSTNALFCYPSLIIFWPCSIHKNDRLLGGIALDPLGNPKPERH